LDYPLDVSVLYGHSSDNSLENNVIGMFYDYEDLMYDFKV